MISDNTLFTTNYAAHATGVHNSCALMRGVGSTNMIMIGDDTLVPTDSVAVDNIIGVEVDLEFGP